MAEVFRNLLVKDRSFFRKAIRAVFFEFMRQIAARDKDGAASKFI